MLSFSQQRAEDSQVQAHGNFHHSYYGSHDLNCEEARNKPEHLDYIMIRENQMPRYDTLPPLVVILGYNAIGKSRLAIELALRFDGEVISADSRQVYRRLDIGTAKVSLKEQQQVPHHLLDVAEPGETFSLADYQKMAFAAIASIHERGRLPILVGGTGLYIWAVVDNLIIPPCPPDHDLRRNLDQKTTQELIDMLRSLDPVSASQTNLTQNRRRLIRALEVCLKTGMRFSDVKRKGAPKYDVLQIGLTMPWKDLLDRVDRRVDHRVQMGMVDEVRQLLAEGVTHEWLESLGLEYYVFSKYLRGDIDTEAEAVQLLKTGIHQFSRRQRSWFKRDMRINWLEADANMVETASDSINRFLQERHDLPKCLASNLESR